MSHFDSIEKQDKDNSTASPRVVTLGCRLNIAESEVMKTWAKDQNLNNAIIVNTCAVTNEAERQARQTIRHLRRENPDAYIIATGCAVQLRPQAFAAMTEIDRVLGNSVKSDPFSFSKDFPHRVDVGPIPLSSVDVPIPDVNLQGRSKAFVQVQNGCNHFCTFCTIPLARGRSRSVSLDHLIPHVGALLNQGVKEIILTGVDMTSYESDGLSLGGMIKNLLKALPDLGRIRLSSLDSMEVCPDLLDLIVNEEKIMPHIHLSLQAGSDPILQSMKRRHSRHHALALCQILKKNRPELALGADFIAGFPGESDAMFQETLRLVDEAALTHLHVFPFSKRPGTPAARMANQIPHDIIKSRAALLRDRGKEKMQQWLQTHVGQTLVVLTEREDRGHSNNFCDIRFDTAVAPNTLITAEITQSTDTYLMAKPII